jgi:hypothetical protein
MASSSQLHTSQASISGTRLQSENTRAVFISGTLLEQEGGQVATFSPDEPKTTTTWGGLRHGRLGPRTGRT